MAAATKEQISALEKAHKEQFYLLVAADKLWLSMSKKFAVLPNTDPRKIALINYGKFIAGKLGTWYARQLKYEKANIPVVPIDMHNDWFNTERLPFLEALVKKLDKTGKGLGCSQMGFIPLLIWAVVAIVGFFTAEKVVDELNTTAEEKTALMDETAKRCKELNLSGTDCATIIEQTQKEASAEGGFSSTLKYGLLLAAAAIAIPALTKGK